MLLYKLLLLAVLVWGIGFSADHLPAPLSWAVVAGLITGFLEALVYFFAIEVMEKKTKALVTKIFLVAPFGVGLLVWLLATLLK